MNTLVYLIQAPPSWLKTSPLSLIYLRNYLKARGFKARVTDLNMEAFKATGATQEQWLTLNRDFEENLFLTMEKKYPDILENLYEKIKLADFIGFSLTKRNASFSFSLAKKINDKFKNKKIIFGGPHVLFLDREKKLDTKNYWIVGEGEIPISKVIQGNKKRVYRFQEIKNLDSLPFYDFDSLDTASYSPYLPLFSSRGCLYCCNFCSEKQLIKTFRHHSPEYMIDQIKLLQSKYNTNNFIFCDSLINYKKKWLEDFCNLVLKSRLKINWEAQIRVDKTFPVELAKLVKQAGCYNLFVGLESGSDRVLKLMNKGFNTQNAAKFFSVLNSVNLHFEISLIFGYPQETDNDVKQTLSFITKNKTIIPKIAQVNPFIDYLNDFNATEFPSKIAKERMAKFIKFIKQEKIRYTKSFVGNLIYS